MAGGLRLRIYSLEPKFLYLSYLGLEVTSSAIVGLSVFLDSPNLPKEGLSGLLWKFYCHNGLDM